MNICFLCYEYAKVSQGGLGVSTGILARQLAKNHSISVITSANGERAATYIDDGVIVYAVRPFILRIPILNIWFGDLIHKLCYNVQVYNKVRTLEKDTIVIAPEFGFEGLLPALNSWRVVTSLATPSFIDELYNKGKISLQNKIISWCERKQTMLSKKIVAKTYCIRDYIGECWNMPVERMAVLYNAIAVSGVSGAPEVDGPYLLFAGRIDKRKGADVLLQAFTKIRARFPSLQCLFVGGDLMNLVADYKQSNPAVPVAHYSQVAHERLLAIIHHAAVVVVPSRFENCSMVCLEALVLGRPLIVTEKTGAAELIEPGVSGFSIPNEDSEKLAETIAHCLTHDMTAFSQRAKERAERYNAETIHAKYEHFLLELV
jgi:glycogen synthase